jgi:hypothetical protein
MSEAEVTTAAETAAEPAADETPAEVEKEASVAGDVSKPQNGTKLEGSRPGSSLTLLSSSSKVC